MKGSETRKPFTRLLSLLMVLLLLAGMAAVPAAAESPLPSALAAQEKAFVAPTAVELNCYSKTMLPGTTFQLEAYVLPDGSDGEEAASPAVTWKSSKKSVAKVSRTGVVTAVKSGVATITATTTNRKGKKQSAKCVITVSYDMVGVKYRFFGIANFDYYGTENDLDSPYNDLAIMEATYDKGIFSGPGCDISTWENCTGSEIRSILSTMPTSYGITENDVTVFYYSGHGLASDTMSMRGALCGTDAGSGSPSAYVAVSEVQYLLEQVPGVVIVILDSCLSGQYIRQKGVEAAAAPTQADVNAFNNEWVAAFSRSRAKNFNPNSKALADSEYKSKFKVLAGCAALQSSYLANFRINDELYPFSFLTMAFCDGAIPYSTETGIRMDADKNRDQVVSLREIYNYTRPLVNKYIKALNKMYPKAKAKQSVKVWPLRDNIPVLAFLPT